MWAALVGAPCEIHTFASARSFLIGAESRCQKLGDKREKAAAVWADLSVS